LTAVRGRLSVLVLLVLVVVGCGRIPYIPSEEASSPSDRKAAGEEFGFITEADAAKRTITFDQAEWLDGEEGRRAAVEDGAIGSNEPLSNDYYIRNADRRTRVLELGSSATVRAAVPVTALAVRPPSDCASSSRCTSYDVSLPAFFASFRKPRHPDGLKFWLTIQNGKVVELDEQYVP
jgi:hypothetical protein